MTGEPMLTLLSKRQSDAVRRVTTAEGQIKHLLVRFVQGAPRTITASPRSAKSSVLNARETEIINHISHGLSNKEIARALRLAPDTIKWHLKKIYEKLNVSSRIEAVQSGLGLTRNNGIGS